MVRIHWEGHACMIRSTEELGNKGRGWNAWMDVYQSDAKVEPFKEASDADASLYDVPFFRAWLHERASE